MKIVLESLLGVAALLVVGLTIDAARRRWGRDTVAIVGTVGGGALLAYLLVTGLAEQKRYFDLQHKIERDQIRDEVRADRARADKATRPEESFRFADR